VANRYSQIAANGNIAVTAGSLANTGRDLVQTVLTEDQTRNIFAYCGRRILGICFSTDYSTWFTTTTDTSSATIGALYGTITAGGTLAATVSGYLNNDAVRGAAGQIGLGSGNRVPASGAAPGNPGATGTGISFGTGAGIVAGGVALQTARATISSQTLELGIADITGRSALFLTVADPAMPFRVETRPGFVDPAKFLGSDYMIKRLGYDSDQTLRRLGDASSSSSSN
jgi:hypothetical protein